MVPLRNMPRFRIAQPSTKPFWRWRKRRKNSSICPINIGPYWYMIKKNIVGKLSQLDIIKALEPKYGEMGDIESLSRFGLSRKFISSILEHNYCGKNHSPISARKAAGIKSQGFHAQPDEGEYVNEDASLEMACHQLVLGHHQSLLVTHGDKIVGI
jgi:hypothetical protein